MIDFTRTQLTAVEAEIAHIEATKAAEGISPERERTLEALKQLRDAMQAMFEAVESQKYLWGPDGLEIPISPHVPTFRVATNHGFNQRFIHQDPPFELKVVKLSWWQRIKVWWYGRNLKKLKREVLKNQIYPGEWEREYFGSFPPPTPEEVERSR